MRMQENRKSVRWLVKSPTRFKVLGQKEGAGQERMALLRDISFVGAQFSVAESLRLNDKLDMVMEMPDENNLINCQGKVVWQKSAEEGGSPHFICGLSFTQIKDNDREKIFQYVRNYASKDLWNKWWKDIK